MALPKVSISEITPGLFIGNLWTTYNPPLLVEHKITYILSVSDEFQALWRRESFIAQVPPSQHLKIRCLDSSHQDLLYHMTQACDFIQNALSSPVESRVMVHCIHGVSRSATFVIAYLMRLQRRPLRDVLADVQKQRPRVKPSANFLAQLEVWEQLGYEPWEDSERRVPKAAYAKLVEEKGLTPDMPARPADLRDW